MSNRQKPLISMVKKEEISALMLALQRAKKDVDSARAYAHLNPVCSTCEKSQLRGVNVLCIKMSDGIRCCRCTVGKKRCPRLVDFWITHIAGQLGRSEMYVRNLYTMHCGPTSCSRESGSKNSKKKVESSSRGTVLGPEEDEELEELELEEDDDSHVESDEDEASVDDDEEEIHVLSSIPKPKTKAGQNSIRASTNHREVAVTHNDSKSELAFLKKENELMKHRAETAESNFVALVGRVQDFRTALRSEIRTMPPGVHVNDLSRLSTAMETTIDDSGLYLRTIQSDALEQSRTNWEIQYGPQAKVDKEKEGGSKEPKRQIRQRSPEPSARKRQKI